MRKKLSLVLLVLVLAVLAFAQVTVTPRRTAVLREFSDVNVAVATIDGEFVALAANSGRGVVLYDAYKNRVVKVLGDLREKIADAAFSNDKSYLAALAENGSVRVWDLRVLTGDRKGKELLKDYSKAIANPKALTMSSIVQQEGTLLVQRTLLVVGSEEGLLRFYDVLAMGERPLEQVDVSLPVSDLFFLSDEKTLVVVSDNKFVLFNYDDVRKVRSSGTKYLSSIPHRVITLSDDITAVAKLNYVEKDAALVGLEDGSIVYVNFAPEAEGKDYQIVSLGKFFSAPVQTIAVSSYPKRERVVFAASKVTKTPIKDIDSRVRLLSNRDKLTDVIYGGVGRREVTDGGSVVEGYQGAVYGSEGGTNPFYSEALGWPRKPQYAYDGETLILEEEPAPGVVRVESFVRIYDSEEVRIERQAQELAMFVIDLKDTKDDQLKTLKGIYTPRPYSFNYRWLAEDELDKIRNIKVAVLDPFLDRYYERFTRISRQLDRERFYLVLGTEEEIVRIELTATAGSRQLSKDTAQAQTGYVARMVDKFDFYGPKSPVDHIRVPVSGRYLLGIDSGMIKMWDLTNLDRVEMTEPRIVFRPANDLPIEDFAIISAFGILVVTDGQEVIVLRSERGFEAALRGEAQFVPYARYSAGAGAKFIKLEVFFSGRENRYYALAFLNNGQVRVIELGKLEGGRFVPTSGYWRVLGREFPKGIESIMVKVIHHEREPGTLEPYIVTIERLGREDYSVKFWRILGDELIAEIKPGALVESPEAIAVSDDGAFIAIATRDSVKVYRFADLLKQSTRPYNIVEIANVTAVDVIGGSKPAVVMGNAAGEIHIARLVDRAQAVIKPTEGFVGHENSKVLKVIAKEARIIASFDDATIKIFEF